MRLLLINEHMKDALDLELLELVVLKTEEGKSELTWSQVTVMISVERLEVLINWCLSNVLMKNPDNSFDALVSPHELSCGLGCNGTHVA
jgi:predicted deacetylase